MGRRDGLRSFHAKEKRLSHLRICRKDSHIRQLLFGTNWLKARSISSTFGGTVHAAQKIIHIRFLCIPCDHDKMKVRSNQVSIWIAASRRDSCSKICWRDPSAAAFHAAEVVIAGIIPLPHFFDIPRCMQYVSVYPRHICRRWNSAFRALLGWLLNIGVRIRTFHCIFLYFVPSRLFFSIHADVFLWSASLCLIQHLPNVLNWKIMLSREMPWTVSSVFSNSDEVL